MRGDLFSAEESLKLREKFIYSFTDKSQSLRIQPYPEGNRCTGYIWEHLTDCTIVRSAEVLRMITKQDSIYVMWDMVKFPDDHRLDLPFPRDRIAKVSGAELAEYLSEIFPPPMGCYVFDDSFRWHITLTNEYDNVMIDGEYLYDCICFVTV